MILLLLACVGEDDTAGPVCEPTGAVIELGAESTEIHGTSTFHEGLLWVAWAVPNASSTFDIRMAAIDCSGEVVIPETVVTDSPDNELDPSIAVADGRVMVAWTVSAGGGLGIRTRVFDTDGEALGDALDFVANRDGEVVTGNAMAPRLRAWDPHFLLVGQWGHDDASGFQAFSVRLDQQGQTLEAAQDGRLETEFSQTAVDVDADGTMVWQEDTTTSTQPRVADASGPIHLPGARPTITVGTGGTWMAWDNDLGEVQLRLPTEEVITLDLPGFVHSARLDGDRLLTMTVEDGVYNSLHVHRIDETGVVDTTVVGTVTAPSVYGVDLTRVNEDVVAIAWQEGDNPDFQLKVRFLQ